MAFFTASGPPSTFEAQKQPGDVDQSDPNDALYIANKLLPGELDLSDVSRELARQHKRGSGDDGAEPHFKGLKPCDFAITIKLHTDEQVDAWWKLRPLLLDYNEPKNRNQVSIAYPLLSEAGITAVVVYKISTKKPKGGDPLTVTISCSSVRHKTGGTTKPKQTTYSAPKTTLIYKQDGSYFSKDYGLDEHPAFYANLPLKDRKPTALQQAQIANGAIPLFNQRGPF